MHSSQHSPSDAADRSRDLELHITRQERQTQALVSLLSYLRLDAPFPLLDDWAAAPDLLLHLANTVVQRRPRSIVECGSGVSTLVLARTAQLARLPTRIVSLEHDSRYLESTSRLLSLHGLSESVDLRLAPLCPTQIDDHNTNWYERAAISDLLNIEMLIVDGPPSYAGPFSRYPAAVLLGRRLAETALVLLDDAARSDESQIADMWEGDVLSDFIRKDRRKLLRGLTEFQRSKTAH